MQRKQGSARSVSVDAGPTTFEVPFPPLLKAATLAVVGLALTCAGVLLFMGRGQIIDAMAGTTTLISGASETNAVGVQSLTAVTQLPLQLSATGKHKAALKAGGTPAKASEPKKQQPSGSGAPRVITVITLSNGTKMQILDEPIPEDCYGEEHLDLDGFAVQWGLGNKARSAAECCRQCKEFVPPHAEVPSPCNVWVWCGDPSGVCWTMDIHKHTTGDCWLKHQPGWDRVLDRIKSNLKVNHEHRFSDAFRAEHKTAPELVPWTAGVVSPKASGINAADAAKPAA